MIEEVIAVEKGKNQRTQIIKIIKKYIDQGVYLSKHLCGRAMDIAKDKGHKDLISFLTIGTHLKILDEGDHFHLEVTTKCEG